MLERQLQTKCVEYLKNKDIYHLNVFGSGRCSKGAPDIIACINGLFVAFELKVGSNDMQADQIIHKRRIERSHGLHFKPYTIEEFVDIVEDLRNKTTKE